MSEQEMMKLVRREAGKWHPDKAGLLFGFGGDKGGPTPSERMVLECVCCVLWDVRDGTGKRKA